MAWNKQLFQLRDAMARLIPYREDAKPYLEEANINWLTILLVQNPTTLWHNILDHTDNNNKTDDLVKVLLIHFPDNPHLISYKQNLDYTTGAALKEADLKGTVDDKTLEKITGAASTLLPIHFLEMGIKKARSVARILIKRPNGTEAGTGFLLPDNLLITNNHVIKNKADAKSAIIQFGYEKSITGLDMVPTEFRLDPDPPNNFATSPEEENDWTAVRIKGDANTAFGAIQLEPATIALNDFVNIIQHPGGQYKQIGMYHNLVTYSDDKIVQYLTDTEPGSSGSPVFNSQWQVVALHHSGGMLEDPVSKKLLLRNEGININLVIEGIKANNL